MLFAPVRDTDPAALTRKLGLVREPVSLMPAPLRSERVVVPVGAMSALMVMAPAPKLPTRTVSAVIVFSSLAVRPRVPEASPPPRLIDVPQVNGCRDRKSVV